MRVIRRGNKLSRNQRKSQKELKKEIDRIKRTAKIVSHGIPHKQVKIATEHLMELYQQPRFRDNHNFLLRRYSDLERRNVIWYNVVVPFIVSIITTFALEDSFRKPLEQKILGLFGMIEETFSVKPSADWLFSVMYWGSYALVVVLMAILALLVFDGVRLIFNSFKRSPEETIKENEMKIIKALLCECHIFVQD